jgi:hypothetical protein
MCAKKPKTPEERPPVFLTNPLLSGLQIGGAVGRNTLRTDLPAVQTGPSDIVNQRDTQQRTMETALNAARSAANGGNLMQQIKYKDLRIKYQREF